MAFGKRIILFLGLNILVVLTISVLLTIFGVRPYLSEYGLDIPHLAIFCLMYGFAGSFISLGLSRVIAKWAYGVQLIDPQRCSERERWLMNKVYELAKRAGMDTMPEVGIYSSEEANAFATGPTRSRALVAVSSGLFQLMDEEEIEGVIGHEISHITNGDMVTMSLLQGVVNAFAMFLARLVAYLVTRDRAGNNGLLYYGIMYGLQFLLLFLGAIIIATYSRHRECRADDGAVKLAGRDKMIKALEALQRTYDRVDMKGQPAVQNLKISSQPQGIWKLWSTHPPLDERIKRLREGH